MLSALGGLLIVNLTLRFGDREVFMSTTLDAIFDGNVFRPDVPIQMKQNTRVHITVEAVVVSEQESESFLNVARSLNLEGTY